jgi:hypothetical protein
VSLADGQDILLYQGPQNLLYSENVLDWPRKQFIYLPELAIERDGSGRYAVATRIGSQHRLFLKLRTVPADVDSIYAALKRTHPYAKRENLLPLSPHELSISVAGVRLDDVPLSAISNFGLSSNSVEFSGAVDPDVGADIVAGLNGSVFMPTVSARVVQWLSAENVYNMQLNRLLQQEIFQDYFGPSGPKFITAAQEADIAVSINEMFTESAWQESTENVRQQFFQFVFDKLRSPTPQELSLEGVGWAKGLLVETADLSKFTDEIRAVAYDARNATNSEWCRKYRELWENNESLIRARSGGVKIPIKKLIFGASGKSDKTKTRHRRNETDTSDCGQTFAQQQFSYSEEPGTRRFIPKSIRVYQVLGGSSELESRVKSSSFTISQRYTEVQLPVRGPN